MLKQKESKESLDLKLLTLIHSLRPFEEIKIKKDEFGKPGRIIVLASSTTILDYKEYI